MVGLILLFMNELLKQIAERCAQIIEEEGRFDGPAHIEEYLRSVLTPAEVDGGSIPDNRIDIIVRTSPAGLRCGEPVMVLLPNVQVQTAEPLTSLRRPIHSRSSYRRPSNTCQCRAKLKSLGVVETQSGIVPNDAVTNSRADKTL
jgi:hypothetical protein